MAEVEKKSFVEKRTSEERRDTSRRDEKFDLKIGGDKKTNFKKSDRVKEERRKGQRRAKNFSKIIKKTTNILSKPDLQKEQNIVKKEDIKEKEEIKKIKPEVEKRVRRRERDSTNDTSDSNDPSSLQREIKQLKRELRREQRASKSADKFEQEMMIKRKELDLIINSHIIYIQTDTDLIVTEVSRAFGDMFGYSPKDIVGQDVNILVRDEDSQKFYNGCEYVSSHGKESWGTDLLMIHNENKTLYTKIFIYPVFEAGVFNGFAIIVQDTHDSFMLNKLKVSQLAKEKYEQTTLDYMRGTSVAILSTVSSKISMVVKIISFIILSFFVWASVFDIEEIVKGDGQVIPYTKVKSIKNLEGGVVKSIYIKEGDKVRKGQLLLKLSDTSYKIKLNDSIKKIAELQIKMLRLDAEANDMVFSVDDDLKFKYPMLMKLEQNRYVSDKKELNSKVTKLKEQLNTQMSIASDANNSYSMQDKNYKSRLKELKDSEKLAKKGVFSKYDIANIKREVNTMLSSMVSSKEKYNQAQNSINEIKSSIKEAKLIFQNEAQDQYSQIISELDTERQTIKDIKEIIQRTYVRTPVDGTIKELLVNTIDSSVGSSEELITIVPDNSDIISELRVTPENIGKLYVGQKVFLKVTAFDYSLYGNLIGKIINISPDTKMDPKSGAYFYIVQIRTEKNYLDNDEKNKLKVGMKVNSDIIVGKKTILEFILKPVLKSTQK